MYSSFLTRSLIKREACWGCGPTLMHWQKSTVRLPDQNDRVMVFTAHFHLGDLISNFIESLTLANLTPKRFLLQTGAKHYGFHVR
jgi:hypothetical protein